MKQWINTHVNLFRAVEKFVCLLVLIIAVDGIFAYILYTKGWIGPIVHEDGIEVDDATFNYMNDQLKAIESTVAEKENTKSEPVEEDSGIITSGDDTTVIKSRVEDADVKDVLLATESGENVALHCPANWFYRSASYIDTLKQIFNNEEIEAPNFVLFCNGADYYSSSRFMVASPISQTDKLTEILNSDEENAGDVNLTDSYSDAYVYFTTGRMPDNKDLEIVDAGVVQQGENDYHVYLCKYTMNDEDDSESTEDFQYNVCCAYGPQEDCVEIMIYSDNSDDVNVYKDLINEALNGR